MPEEPEETKLKRNLTRHAKTHCLLLSMLATTWLRPKKKEITIRKGFYHRDFYYRKRCMLSLKLLALPKRDIIEFTRERDKVGANVCGGFSVDL